MLFLALSEWGGSGRKFNRMNALGLSSSKVRVVG